MEKFTASILLVIFVVSLSPAYAETAGKDMTWVLSQTTDKLGKIVIHIHKDQVKVDKVGGYSIICKSPSWKVVLFDSKRRVMSERTYKDWVSRGLYSALGAFDAPSDESRTLVLDRKRGSMFMNVEVFPETLTAVSKHRNDKEFLVAPAITGDVHVFKFLRTLFDLEIPLECAVISWKSRKGSLVLLQSNVGKTDRGVVPDLSTQEIKRVPFAAKDFAYPDGFKHVADSDIVMGSKDDLINDFLPP